MARTRRRALGVLLVMALAMASATRGFAAQGEPRPAERRRPAGAPANGDATVPDGRYEPDLERIREALKRPFTLLESLEHVPPPMFRVQVERTLPIETLVGDPKRLQVGPVSTPWYHAEFLRMVTPPELAASWTNGEVAQLLVTGLAGAFALKNLTSAIKESARSRRSRAACQEVVDSVTDLNQERVRAGLAPVPVPEC